MIRCAEMMLRGVSSERMITTWAYTIDECLKKGLSLSQPLTQLISFDDVNVTFAVSEREILYI